MRPQRGRSMQGVRDSRIEKEHPSIFLLERTICNQCQPPKSKTLSTEFNPKLVVELGVWGRSSWVTWVSWFWILKAVLTFRLSLSELWVVNAPNLEGMQKCIMTENWTNVRSRNIVMHILLPVSILHGTISEALRPGLAVGRSGSRIKAASRGSESLSS